MQLKRRKEIIQNEIKNQVINIKILVRVWIKSQVYKKFPKTIKLQKFKRFL